METRLLSNYTCTYLREIQYYQGNIHGTQASRFKASTLTSQNSKKKKGIPNQSNFTPECCVILRSYFTLAMFAPAFNKTEMYALLLVKTNFSEKKKKKKKKLVLTNTDKHKSKLRISRHGSHQRHCARTNLGRTWTMNDSSFDNSSQHWTLRWPVRPENVCLSS